MDDGGKHSPWRWWQTGVLTVLVFVVASLGQAPAEDQPGGALATKQQMILDRLARLEDRMFRLREKLAAREPENARKLADALRRAGEMDLKDRVQALVHALGETATLPDAADQQRQLLDQYRALLDVLLERNPDDARHKAELERLKRIRKELDRLVERQKDIRREAGKRMRAASRLRDIEQAAKRARQLLADQEKLNTQGTDTPADPRAQRQEQLEARARRLAEDLPQLQARNAKDPANSAANQALQAATEQTRSAAQSMKEAAKETRETPATQPKKRQEEATENLRRAVHKLEEARQNLEGKTGSKENAPAQRALAEDARKLSQDMRGAPEGETPKSSPAPGAENVERAQQHMRQAGEELEQQHPEQGTREQDQALDELKRAQGELEDRLRQKRMEDQEEKLRSLEARLKEMRAEQAQINESTASLNKLGAEHFTRADTLQCAELAQREGQQAEAGDTCLRLLEEDGTTVVFPRVMRQLAGDLHKLAERLAGSEVGLLTLSAEDDALTTMDELLDALAKLRKKREDQKMAGGGGGASGGNDAPLVPTSAELKMLRNAQQRINRQTQTAQAAREGDDESEDTLRALLERAAAQQGELAEMARDIQKRAEKEHGR